MNDVLSARLRKLPESAGVYLMMDEKGHVVYIGKAKNLKKRVSSYFAKRALDPKTESLVKHIASLDWVVTETEREAVILEAQFIKKHRPKYNILLRDDKSFPYIRISQHPFPALTIYRGMKLKNDLLFGPYPSSKSAREIILWLQKNFKIRNCSDAFFRSRKRPCLQHQIHRCTAPCVNLISTEEYNVYIEQAKLFLQGKNHALLSLLQTEMNTASESERYEQAMKCRDIIRHLHELNEKQSVDVGRSDVDVLAYESNASRKIMFILSIREGRVWHAEHIDLEAKESDPSEIMESFISQYYFSERGVFSGIYPSEIILSHPVPESEHWSSLLSQQFKRKVVLTHSVRGKRMDWLNMALSNAKEKLRQLSSAELEIESELLEFKNTFHLTQLPERIECYDVSHHLGESSVGSMVVFHRLKPNRSRYRLFNIKRSHGADDLSSLKEMLLRRFEKCDVDSLPDLVLIDGGELQLNAAHSVLKEMGMEELNVLSVSKGPKRKAGFELIHRLNGEPRHLPEDSRLLHTIQFARDEAHRFAITRHRKKQRTKRVQSVLEQIEGVGEIKRRALLMHFGGIQALLRASLNDIAKVPQIGLELAKRIYRKLHE